VRRRRPRPGNPWHLDEVFLRISGRTYALWRAGGHEGAVLDILGQPQRDTRAATRFFRKLLTGLRYVPRVVITDKLASYGAARHDVLPSVEHRQRKRLNNRAENAHQPTRERERHLRRFTSPGHAQRFLAARPGTSASPPGARSPAYPARPERPPLLALTGLLTAQGMTPEF